MKSMDAKHYLLRVALRRDKVPSFAEYPYNLPVVRKPTVQVPESQAEVTAKEQR